MIRFLSLVVMFLAFCSHAQLIRNMYGQNATTYNFTNLTPVTGPTNTTLGLVNWWPFDENTGSTAADSIGSANGTAIGGTPVTWVSGQINSALNFDFDHVLPDGGGLRLAANTATGNGAFTVACWYKNTESTYGGEIIYDKSTANGIGDGFHLMINDDGSDTIKFQISFDNFPILVVTTQSIPSDGAWHFLTALWTGASANASTVHIYTNNATELTYSLQDNGDGNHVANTSTNRWIASDSHSAGSPTYLQGSLDNVEVWSRALSAGEIRNMYQLGLLHLNQ